MIDSTEKYRRELRRLENGPTMYERPSGMGTVNFIARCPMGSPEVLDKVKSVLKAVDDVVINDGWLSDEGWKTKLPEWFVIACAPAETREEAEKSLALWRTLSSEEQDRIRREERWSVEDWIYCLQPENRYWFWWDAKSFEKFDHIIVMIETYDWPFPWDAMRWLFLAAGASALDAEIAPG